LKESRRRGIRRYQVLCFVLLSLLLSFGPGVLSIGWYVIHKHAISFNNRTLIIPMGWSLAPEDVTQNGIIFRKRSAFLFGHENFQIMMFSRFPSSWIPSSTAYEGWRSYVTRMYSPVAFVDMREQQIGADSRRFCVSVSFKATPTMLRSANCLLLREGIWAEFGGTSNGLEDFLGVVGKIH
jgi:hypothetical protein